VPESNRLHSFIVNLNDIELVLTVNYRPIVAALSCGLPALRRSSAMATRPIIAYCSVCLSANLERGDGIEPSAAKHIAFWLGARRTPRADPAFVAVAGCDPGIGLNSQAACITTHPPLTQLVAVVSPTNSQP